MDKKYIVYYVVRVKPYNIRTFWIRPEHTTNSAENATRFASSDEAINFVTSLHLPNLIEIKTFEVYS